MNVSIKSRFFAVILALVLIVTALPVSAGMKKDDGEFKVLFIGNSYSDDVTDGGYFEDSTLYNIMKSMVGDREIGVGLLWSGGKTMAWHASMAKQDLPYSFFYTDSSDGWSYVGGRTPREALTYTDWDAIVLQPYGLELVNGTSSHAEGMLSEFLKIDVSTPYMLDFVAKHAPQAEAYLYLIMAAGSSNAVNAFNDSFRTIAATTATMETYVGTESGKGFAGVIPVGSAIQAARNTYLTYLNYNTSRYNGANITAKDDPVMGLQRDDVHQSLVLGRYIAGLTAALTLIPEEARSVDYTLPHFRDSEQIGRLPSEYMDIAIACADAAIASLSRTGKSRFIPSNPTGFKNSPVPAAEEAIKNAAVTVPAVDDATALKGKIAEAVKAVSGFDVKVSVTLKGDYTAPAKGQSTTITADISFTHGYSEKVRLAKDITVSHGATVTVTAGKGGAAEPSGPVFVSEGGSLTVKFTPDEGYDIADVKVNGTSVGTVSEYTVENVTSDTTVDVSFARGSSFTDVPKDAWYYPGVTYAFNHGYMKGTNTDMTLFSPDMQFTREQFVQLLFNMEGLDAEDFGGDTGFSDVPAGQWYSAAVKWAKEEGVTNGIGGGVFGLGGKVSREQLSQFLKNYAELKSKDTSARSDITAFSDGADVSTWATDAVSWAVAEGIIGSTQTGAMVLAPGRVAVRSEIAKITMSYDAYLAK